MSAQQLAGVVAIAGAVGGFYSLREAQAQKKRIKDRRNAEARDLAEALTKLADYGVDFDNQMSSIKRIAERQRSAYRFALQELRRMAEAASPASSVIPIAVLGAHESPTMIVAAGIYLLADHALFQQYIMGPLLQVAMSGSGLGRGGVTITGANSPVDPEEIAKFGFVLSELTERGVNVLLKWTDWLVKTDAGLNLASFSAWKQPLTPTPRKRLGAEDKSPYVFSKAMDCVKRAANAAESTSDGTLHVEMMQTATDFTESAIFALEGLGFYCLQLDRCSQSNVKIRNRDGSPQDSSPVRHLAVQYQKKGKQKIPNNAGDIYFEFKAGQILVANFNLHNKVALPLEENGTHITLDMEAARAGGVQVPRASRRGKKNNGYDFAKPCPKFFDVAMMDRREQFLQAVALIQIGDAMRKRIQREDLVGATLEHFACLAGEMENVAVGTAPRGFGEDDDDDDGIDPLAMLRGIETRAVQERRDEIITAMSEALYDRIPCDEDSGVTNDDVESEVDSFVPKFVQLIEAKLLQSPRTRSAVHPHKLVKLPAPDVEILDHIGCYTTINPAKSEKLVAYASELHRRRTREVEVMAEVPEFWDLMLAALMLVAAGLTYITTCIALRRLFNTDVVSTIVPVVNMLSPDIVPALASNVVPVINTLSLASMVVSVFWMYRRSIGPNESFLVWKERKARDFYTMFAWLVGWELLVTNNATELERECYTTFCKWELRIIQVYIAQIGQRKSIHGSELDALCWRLQAVMDVDATGLEEIALDISEAEAEAFLAAKVDEEGPAPRRNQQSGVGVEILRALTSARPSVQEAIGWIEENAFEPTQRGGVRSGRYTGPRGANLPADGPQGTNSPAADASRGPPKGEVRKVAGQRRAARTKTEPPLGKGDSVKIKNLKSKEGMQFNGAVGFVVKSQVPDGPSHGRHTVEVYIDGKMRTQNFKRENLLRLRKAAALDEEGADEPEDLEEMHIRVLTEHVLTKFGQNVTYDETQRETRQVWYLCKNAKVAFTQPDPARRMAPQKLKLPKFYNGVDLDVTISAAEFMELCPGAVEAAASSAAPAGPKLGQTGFANPFKSQRTTKQFMRASGWELKRQKNHSVWRRLADGKIVTHSKTPSGKNFWRHQTRDFNRFNNND